MEEHWEWKWLLWDLSLMVLAGNRLSTLPASLFSCSYLIQTFLKMQFCQQKKTKAKGMGLSWWLKDWWVMWVRNYASNVFVFCCFSFSHLPPLCALIKSRGLKQYNQKLCCCVLLYLLICLELGISVWHRWRGDIFTQNTAYCLCDNWKKNADWLWYSVWL